MKPRSSRRRRTRHAALLMLALLVLASGRLPAQQADETAAADRAVLQRYGKRDVSLHDPSSIVRCGDEYWMFSTGRLVRSWRSRDLTTWQEGPRVFAEMPGWVTEIVPDQRGHFWAPDVIRLGERYLVYYSVSSFGKNTSAIALATNVTLDPEDETYRWVDEGVVIRTDQASDYNAIDPAVVLTGTGELWMSFGSFWSGLKLVQLDPATGKRIQPDSPVHALAWKEEIEAAHIVPHAEWYYLFVNWGKCCRGVESTYNIRVGRSRQITGPYLDRDGIDLRQGGGTLVLNSAGPFIGPGHANVLADGERFVFHCHYYDATERGRPHLAIMQLTWDPEGWPVVPAAE